MLDGSALSKITFWTLFTGFHATFLVQRWLGVEGMPRRYADYLAADGFTALNSDLDASPRSCSVCRSCRSSTTSGRP
ncbi:cbb3-type cytochrome c oxidase subunit I, partial [Streptomyces sp. KL116D]|uniref:cbb3-type cytochrome c oxidase subunit I n=1 Tax=Streptomyces sp. KL116D TaxID=3045152 RepID=UPI0035592AD3